MISCFLRWLATPRAGRVSDLLNIVVVLLRVLPEYVLPYVLKITCFVGVLSCDSVYRFLNSFLVISWHEINGVFSSRTSVVVHDLFLRTFFSDRDIKITHSVFGFRMDVLLTSEFSILNQWFIVCLHWTYTPNFTPCNCRCPLEIHEACTIFDERESISWFLIPWFCWNWPGSMQFWSCLCRFTSHLVFNAPSHMPKFTFCKASTCLWLVGGQIFVWRTSLRARNSRKQP